MIARDAGKSALDGTTPPEEPVLVLVSTDPAYREAVAVARYGTPTRAVHEARARFEAEGFRVHLRYAVAGEPPNVAEARLLRAAGVSWDRG